MGGHFSSQNVETQTRNLVINSVSIYIYIYIYIRAEFEFGPKKKKKKFIAPSKIMPVWTKNWLKQHYKSD